MATTTFTRARSGAARGFISLDVIGLDQIATALKALGDQAAPVLAKILYQEAEFRVMPEAKKQAPHDLGILEASGMVALPKISGTTVTVEIGFGGAASDYALRQHEELEWHHPQAGKKAKYLEDPFNANLQGFDERVAAALRKELPGYLELE